jgi:hypothetical protein
VLDETLFSIDRRVGPLRAKARSEWDAFLNQFPDPDQTLQDKAFDTFIVRQAEPEYQNLSNRLLQILASFPDVEETFTRLNGEPIDSAQGSQCIYRDNSLPAEGHNRYFYRAKAIDVYGNAAQMSVSTPPIYLRPGRPQAPVITRVTGGDRKIMLTWVSNQDPNLLEYYVYRADNADATSDIGLMKKIGTVLVDPNPAARPVVVEWIDPPQSSGTALPGLKDFWYSVVAVNRVDPLDPLGRGRNVSEPSIVMRGRTFDESLPLVPTLTVTWNATTPPTNALISWISNDQTRLERRGLDMPIWDSIGDWRPPGAYNLIIPMDASYSWQFRLRVKKETNALSIGTATSLPHV